MTTPAKTAQAPQDRKTKPANFIVSEVEIDGKKYPASNKLTFAQNVLCEEEVGKGYGELTPMTAFGVTAWFAMRSVIPSMTWAAFSENTAIENVNYFNAEGVNMMHWGQDDPKA